MRRWKTILTVHKSLYYDPHGSWSCTYDKARRGATLPKNISMKQNPLTQGVVTINSTGVRIVTRELVHARARELALLAGHGLSGVRQSDYEQAKRELTGESDVDRQDAVMEALPESMCWDSIPGLAVRQTSESPIEDEDEEGAK